MTTVQVWAGVDSRGVASLNVVSDSRITWGSADFWDGGRKVFYCHNAPHVFAYWGHALFPALALVQLSDQIDQTLATGDTPEQWKAIITEQLYLMVDGYPQNEEFTILHLGRHGEGMSSEFYAQTFQHPANQGLWLVKDHRMPSTSGLVLCGGSGKTALTSLHASFMDAGHDWTSRAAYMTFIYWLESQRDPFTGGAPQMCRLLRIGHGEPVGVIHHGRRFFTGASVPKVYAEQRASWHNDLFEIADPRTRKRAAGAQRHSRIKPDPR